MANHTGNEGKVSVGGNVVAEVRSWSLDLSVATVDDTVIGDDWETHKTLQKNWSGSAEVFWDETDTAQSACTVGASVALILYPEGNDSGDTYWSGTATVEKWTIKGTHNGMVEASIGFKGNGALAGPSTV
jgi:hypothetical protein